ncbi:hypothetical protein JHK87_045509 [Glycine soja]|nr:hypothetical protein JHK87_045509 [Glycine soja]
MLAKPIANEAAVQVSIMSQCQPSFTLKWFGEDQKSGFLKPRNFIIGFATIHLQ